MSDIIVRVEDAPAINVTIQEGQVYVFVDPAKSGGGSGGTVTWSDIQNKPSTFPPAIHEHNFEDLENIPTSFPPTAHGHIITDISNLQDILNNKSNSNHNHNLNDLPEKSYNSLDNKPDIPSALSQLSDDSTHRLVTDNEKSTYAGKQDALGFNPLDKELYFFGLNPPAWVSQKWYTNAQYVGSAMSTTGPMSQNKLWVTQFLVGKDGLNIDQIGIYCTVIGTLGTGVISIRVFNSDGNNWIGNALINSVELAGFNTSIGAKTASLNYTFNRGKYWFLITSDTNATVILNQMSANWGQATLAQYNNYYYQRNWAYGTAIPSPYDAFDITHCNAATGTQIQVGVRKS